MLYQKSEINKIVRIFSEIYLLIAKCHFIYGKILDIYIYIYLFILLDWYFIVVAIFVYFIWSDPQDMVEI